MESEVLRFLSLMPWYGYVAIVAIVCGSVSGFFKMRCQHAERMAMIQQGMNPDAPDSKPLAQRDL
jgi:hypothetical protein